MNVTINYISLLKMVRHDGLLSSALDLQSADCRFELAEWIHNGNLFNIGPYLSFLNAVVECMGDKENLLLRT